jgi:hypothetical protein
MSGHLGHYLVEVRDVSGELIACCKGLSDHKNDIPLSEDDAFSGTQA